MATVTQTMLANRVGSAELVRLTDDAGGGAVNADVLTRAIDEGESEILSYLGQRYTLPLTLAHSVTNSMVTTKLIDATVYRLYVHRDQVVHESIRQAYADAIAWAKMVAEGRIGLVGESAPSESPAGVGQMLITGATKVISRESMKGL